MTDYEKKKIKTCTAKDMNQEKIKAMLYCSDCGQYYEKPINTDKELKEVSEKWSRDNFVPNKLKKGD
jgi:hypothetical protein